MQRFTIVRLCGCRIVLAVFIVIFNDTFKDIVRSNPDEKLGFAQLIGAGTLAGLFQTCVTYPLETIRTRLTLGAGLGAHYNGIYDVIRTTYRSEGISAL